ncbi:MAG: hypothetical protein ACYDC0_16280 [Acidimicrobiales bacterium]
MSSEDVVSAAGGVAVSLGDLHAAVGAFAGIGEDLKRHNDKLLHDLERSMITRKLSASGVSTGATLVIPIEPTPFVNQRQSVRRVVVTAGSDDTTSSATAALYCWHPDGATIPPLSALVVPQSSGLANSISFRAGEFQLAPGEVVVVVIYGAAAGIFCSASAWVQAMPNV